MDTKIDGMKQLAILATFSVFWTGTPKYSRISVKFGTAKGTAQPCQIIRESMSPLRGQKK